MKARLMIFIFLLSISFGCQPNQTILNDRQPIPAPVENTPEPLIDNFEEKLNSVKTGNFEFIYSFRRKDGDIFTGEDKKFLKDNAPFDTNQWVLTSDKKAVIAGSNYVFTPQNLDALKKRFKFEDHSPIIEETDAEQNSNVNH